jgi:hypothetical protein
MAPGSSSPRTNRLRAFRPRFFAGAPPVRPVYASGEVNSPSASDADPGSNVGEIPPFFLRRNFSEEDRMPFVGNVEKVEPAEAWHRHDSRDGIG